VEKNGKERSLIQPAFAQSQFSFGCFFYGVRRQSVAATPLSRDERVTRDERNERVTTQRTSQSRVIAYSKNKANRSEEFRQALLKETRRRMD
jgi:hypothetical protein